MESGIVSAILSKKVACVHMIGRSPFQAPLPFLKSLTEGLVSMVMGGLPPSDRTPFVKDEIFLYF